MKIFSCSHLNIEECETDSSPFHLPSGPDAWMAWARPVQFLRGTFYRWAQLFPKVCQDLNKASAVIAVGDLHIASFGTRRDGFGRVIWGSIDFDEAWPLPDANDLVRLAVSAVLDASEGEIKVSLGNAVEVILDGYSAALKEGCKPAFGNCIRPTSAV